MANNIGWGQGAVNNSIGWGQGASSNSISWGISQKDSYSGETEIYGIRGDVDALAFNSKVTAAGGTLTATEQAAVNQLVVDLKAKGLWTSMKAIYPMVGSSAAACAQNLKSSSFTGTFAGGWTFASTGATPNGTNAYMSTGYIPLTDGLLNSAHLSYYSRTNINGVYGEVGSFGTSSECYLIFNFGANRFVAMNNSGISAPLLSNTTSMLIQNRRNSTQVQTFKSGILNNTTNVNSVALPNLQMYVGAINLASPIYSTKQCAFSSIGTGLTDTQASDFYTSVQAFQTTLSRQV